MFAKFGKADLSAQGRCQGNLEVLIRTALYTIRLLRHIIQTALSGQQPDRVATEGGMR